MQQHFTDKPLYVTTYIIQQHFTDKPLYVTTYIIQHTLLTSHYMLLHI